ncbi:MAG: bifunctional chorismate mutase/prephenate dehydratase [Christensenellales bacterium]
MELNEYRDKIDKIDNEIQMLFEKRMALSADIAKFKSQNCMPTRNSERERQILARITDQSAEYLAGYERILFSTLFDLSRSYQNQLITKPTILSEEINKAVKNTPPLFPAKGVVACQGVEGAYSQQACDKLFPAASIIYFKNWEGVFQAVESGLCAYGILPIENSIHGTVNEVYDLMRDYKFHIVRSVKLQISHCLLAKPGAALADVREIFSHEQAIGQCSTYLKGLKDVSVTICENTAMASQKVASSPRNDIAAISSPSCAELYGLSVLSDSIQQSDHNYTRFICIAKELAIYPGANKISLMLTVSHTPGALYRMIAKFSVLGVNLTKIESRPIPGKDFEFMFYFDLDASVASTEVVQLLNELSSAPQQFVFLGNYSEI